MSTESLSASGLYQRLSSPVCGILTKVKETERQKFFPDLHVYRGTIAAGLDTSKQDCIRRADARGPIHVSGVGYDRESALFSLLGEAVERYSAANYGAIPAFRATVSRLNKPFLHPDDVVGSRDEKIWKGRSLRFHKGLPIAWVQGANLQTGQDILVPALLALMTAQTQQPEELFEIPVSTGLAAGQNQDLALKAGLFEVIERDAIAIHWLLRRPLHPILNLDAFIDDLPEAAQILLRRHSLLKADAFAMTNALSLPAVMVRLRALKPGAGFSLGAAVADDWPTAIAKAVREACHVWLSYVLSWSPTAPQISIQDIKTYTDHGAFYFNAAQPDLTDWLFAGEGVAVLNSDRKELSLSELIIACQRKQLTVLAVDLTPADIRSLGLSVVRVIVPQLQPLTCGASRKFTDMRRMEKCINEADTPLTHGVNENPHPFA
ncbi:YcaO-like family protein [Brucella pituitosa]|uniref:YcaO-like family protein n=1 Tax=Brucella pituitosa TaxID=571256 RepID=UPI0009A1C8D6|nr:YcaO-like family protein [Brucella pituitosa]